MRFHYKAQNENNEIIEGEAEATDKFELAKNLKAERKTVLYVEELKSKKWGEISLPSWLSFGVGYHDRIIFMKNLSAMLTAGLPLSRALGVFEKQSNNKRMKEVVGALVTGISKGVSFSEAMKAHPRFFSPLATAMIHAGEESGSLPDSLKVVGDEMEKNYQLRKRVRGALMYPSIIFLALIGIGILMFIYVVPTLVGTFKELNVPLPRSTQLIIWVSDFMSQHTFFAISFIVGVLVAFYLGIQSKQGKHVFEVVTLKLPVLGTMIREYNAARTARTLASLLSAGVQVIESISITRDVIQNNRYRKVLEEAQARVQKGILLSKVFSENADLYPPLVSEMVAVGEETGKLADMLHRLALFYEDEVDQKTKDLSTIIEPLIMVFVGIVVGFFAISVITPLYSVGQSF